MTQYVGCDQARTLLEGLVDGELSMADQLAVESHLRWCDTCALRVTDMRLIGESIRSRFVPPADAEDQTLGALTEGVLIRVRAERAQSFRSRVREMFADRHLLWPAVGATAAVMLCVAAATSVLHASTVQTRDSLAGLISKIGAPGTEKWPLRPADNGVSIPRLSDDEGSCTSRRCRDSALRTSGSLELMPEDDVIYAVRAVVGRDGTIGNYEFLSSDDDVSSGDRGGSAVHERALINAVRNMKFEPAQTPLRQAVAVDMVWVIAKTTVIAGPPESLRRRPPAETQAAKEGAKPSNREPAPAAPPVSGQPTMARRSATA